MIIPASQIINWFFVLILVTARLAKIYLGDQGIYLASAASGLADVDAITLSLAEQSKEGSVAMNVAAIGITIAVVANSIVKSLIAIYFTKNIFFTTIWTEF